MSKEFDRLEDSEEKRVAESLMQHMDARFHPYTIAALGAAVAVLNDEVEDEAEIEEILSESCQVFFDFTLAFMYRATEAVQEMLWQTSIKIGSEIYGKDRAQTAASIAIEHYREYEEGREDDFGDEPSCAPPTLN